MTQPNDPPSPKPAGKDDQPKPGDERQDTTRTLGDGTLQGSTPAGLSVEELRRRAEEGGSSQSGTG